MPMLRSWRPDCASGLATASPAASEVDWSLGYELTPYGGSVALGGGLVKRPTLGADFLGLMALAGLTFFAGKKQSAGQTFQVRSSAKIIHDIYGIYIYCDFARFNWRLICAPRAA